MSAWLKRGDKILYEGRKPPWEDVLAFSLAP